MNEWIYVYIWIYAITICICVSIENKSGWILCIVCVHRVYCIQSTSNHTFNTMDHMWIDWICNDLFTYDASYWMCDCFEIASIVGCASYMEWGWGIDEQIIHLVHKYAFLCSRWIIWATTHSCAHSCVLDESSEP